MLSVVVGVAWPRTRATDGTSTPAASIHVAAVWRRSWSVAFTFERARSERNASVAKKGATGPPSGV
jgi:hypothetical protein